MVSLEAILKRPIYLLDFHFQFSELLRYLEFSEQQLIQQRQLALNELRRKSEDHDYDHDSYHSELQTIEHTFDATLPKIVRYSSISAYVTTIEWVSKFLDKSRTFNPCAKAKGMNQSVHLFREMDRMCHQNRDSEISKLNNFIKLRNCVVHSSGIVGDFEFKDDIALVVRSTPGFSITDEGFYGDSILVAPGTMEQQIQHTQQWLLDFIEECRHAGLIDPNQINTSRR